MADFDTNQWYYIALGGDRSSVIRSLTYYSNYQYPGATLMQESNSTKPGERWQIYPIDSNNTYMIRTNDSSPDTGEATGFLGFSYNSTSQKSEVSVLKSDKAEGKDLTWTFVRSKYDTKDNEPQYYLSNKGSGDQFRLAVDGDDLKMDNADMNSKQQFVFYKQDRTIDDENYSKIDLFSTVISTPATPTPGATSSTTPTGSPTNNADPSNPPSSSGGLSTPAKAGIGAAVGVVALIALVTLGLFFWRKRRTQSPAYHRTNKEAQPEFREETEQFAKAKPYASADPYVNTNPYVKAELAANDNTAVVMNTNPTASENTARGYKGQYASEVATSAELPAAHTPPTELPGGPRV